MKQIKTIVINSGLFRATLVLLASVFCGSVLLILAYCIPTDVIANNVRSAEEVFKNQYTWERVIPGLETTRKDNFTDAIMLGEACFESSENVVASAFRNYRPSPKPTKTKETTDAKALNPDSWLVSYLHDDENIIPIDYSRYWHGYLTILKPLLVFLDYQGIILLNCVLQGLLILFFLHLLMKKQDRFLAFACGAAIFFLTPMTSPFSLQYAPIFYITLISSIAIVLRFDKIENKKLWGSLFLAIGCLSSYFDLLTYPIVSLCFPLLLILALSPQSMRLGQSLRLVVLICLSWGVGYIGMWFMKWTLSSAILQENCFPLDRIEMRSSQMANGEERSYFDTLNQLASVFDNGIYYVAIVAIVIIMTCFIWRNRSRIEINFLNVIPYGVVFLIPFIWVAATMNHSFIHYWMVYRIFCVVPLALILGVWKCIVSPTLNAPCQTNFEQNKNEHAAS